MAGKIVRACVDMYPDPDWLIADNDVSFLAAPESTLWKPGTTLHVSFLDGDPRVAYAYYMSAQGWTEQDVDVNLFQLYDESTTRASEFDPTSIMIYPIPNDLTIGDFEVGWTMDLSETDKSFIATLYPKTA